MFFSHHPGVGLRWKWVLSVAGWARGKETWRCKGRSLREEKMVPERQGSDAEGDGGGRGAVEMERTEHRKRRA